jgi:hypothetical protein
VVAAEGSTREGKESQKERKKLTTQQNKFLLVQNTPEELQCF